MGSDAEAVRAGEQIARTRALAGKRGAVQMAYVEEAPSAQRVLHAWFEQELEEAP